MPSLKIPESGLSFESFSEQSPSKAGSSTQDIIGLTLTNSMIEEMIKCVQNGKPIQLSLGSHPNLSFGTTTQQLSQYQDPFAHELYQSEYSNSTHDTQVKSIGKPSSSFQRLMNPNWRAQKPTTTMSQPTAATVQSVTAGADAARDALERSLAEEKARKQGNTTQLLKATLDPKRGPLKGASANKFLAAQGRLNDTTRSMPSSPALSGIGSPATGPTSVPASQLAAERAKAARHPIIHLLAVGSLTESELKKKLVHADLEDDLFETALNKVADKDESTKLFTLRKNYWKELDVWSFNYDTEEDRQTVIDAAVKIYDRMRIQPNDDEWERLKPLETRGDGVTLSKIQAKIAQGPIPRTPRINVDSGLDTPTRDGEEATNKAISRVKKDTKPRSTSQPPAAKAKRVSEKEGQSKRILTTKKKTQPAPRKEGPLKAGGAKPLSSQYVNSDSEEDTRVTKKPVAPKPTSAKPAPAKPAPLVKAKRAREEDAVSDSSLAKKARVSADVKDENKKKPIQQPSKLKHKREEETATSDSSQPMKKARTSEASQSSIASSNVTFKTKGTSPPKSSPLASSPPTNASEFGSSSSDSSTPRHLQNTTATHKRNTSSASSTTSSSSRLSAHILSVASKYKRFHPQYVKLHQELSAQTERERDDEQWENLLEMHERLAKMKREMKEATEGL